MRLLRTSAGLFVLTLLIGCNDDPPTAPTPTSAIALSGNMNFGSVTVGATATATLTIGNSGTGELTITGVSYPSGFTGSFSSGTIAANGSQAVTVTFAPTAAQSYTGNITVTGNQASGTNTIAVSGAGVAIPTFTLSGIVTETPPTTSTVLAGVRVAFVDGANQGKSATTGADGRYQITGVVNGGYTVTAQLAGYTTVALPVGINGNTTLDFRLDPTGAAHDVRTGTIPADRGHSCRSLLQRSGRTAATSNGFVVSAAPRRRSSATHIINFDAGQWIVDLLATDGGFVTDANCGLWYPTPRRGLSQTITPGMWIVGAQITPGTYRAENSAHGCYWQRLSSFTGSVDSIIASAFISSAGVQLVAIANTDVGFSASVECGTWIRQ